ncbi:MAG: hypothetical protein AAFR28_02095 [Pseudomonadota bacterium]
MNVFGNVSRFDIVVDRHFANRNLFDRRLGYVRHVLSKIGFFKDFERRGFGYWRCFGRFERDVVDDRLLTDNAAPC